LHLSGGRRADLALCARPAAPRHRQSVNTARPAQLFSGRENGIRPTRSRRTRATFGARPHPPCRTLPLRGPPSPAALAGAVRSQEVTCFDYLRVSSASPWP
jgi:hypothetical protein